MTIIVSLYNTTFFCIVFSCNGLSPILNNANLLYCYATSSPLTAVVWRRQGIPSVRVGEQYTGLPHSVRSQSVRIWVSMPLSSCIRPFDRWKFDTRDSDRKYDRQPFRLLQLISINLKSAHFNRQTAGIPKLQIENGRWKGKYFISNLVCCKRMHTFSQQLGLCNRDSMSLIVDLLRIPCRLQANLELFCRTTALGLEVNYFLQCSCTSPLTTKSHKNQSEQLEQNIDFNSQIFLEDLHAFCSYRQYSILY